MTPQKITEDCANAANACFKYYCGKALSAVSMNRIMEIIESESPNQSKEHFDYSQSYKAYVNSGDRKFLETQVAD